MSIVHRVEQNTEAWRKLRLGIPTASRFGDIVTPSGEPRSGELPKKYLCELLAERLTGEPVEKYVTAWMARGAALEGDAIAAFCRRTGLEVGRTGFVTTNDGTIGCSPDGVIASVSGDNSRTGVEVKVPAPQTLVYYLVYGLGDNYKAQVQGQMYVGGFDVMHLWAWHPTLPALHVVSERDEGFIKKLDIALAEFCHSLTSQETVLRSQMALHQPPMFDPAVPF